MIIFVNALNTNREKPRERKKKDQSRMAGIWKTQHNNRWSVALTVWTPIWVAKEIEEGNEKGGEINYKST